MNQTLNVKSFRREMTYRPFKNAIKNSLANTPFKATQTIGGAIIFMAGLWSIFFLASLWGFR